MLKLDEPYKDMNNFYNLSFQIWGFCLYFDPWIGNILRIRIQKEKMLRIKRIWIEGIDYKSGTPPLL